tara:strand:- start:114 stop:1091 length:978 start_codon:yes stop_codon:yes gene_type:complete
MFDFIKIYSQRFSFFFDFISKLNIKLLITLICLIFLGNSIYSNFDDLAVQTINMRKLIWLSCGITLTFLSVIINAYAWKLLINSIGCDSRKLNILKIFLSTNLYKYLPGGVWHFVSRYNYLKSKFSTEKSVESILLEPLLMLVSALLFIPFATYNIYIYILCWSSIVVFQTGLRTFIIKKLKEIKFNIFVKYNRINDSELVCNSRTIYSKTFYPYRALFVEIVFIIFRFLGFLCCINAFSIGSFISKFELISFFSLAWMIGLVIPAAPGGVGVFESVILFCLGSQLPEAPLLASLLCYRLVSTISDVFAALVYPVKRFWKNQITY